jgi:hypothetical protein
MFRSQSLNLFLDALPDSLYSNDGCAVIQMQEQRVRVLPFRGM